MKPLNDYAMYTNNPDLLKEIVHAVFNEATSEIKDLQAKLKTATEYIEGVNVAVGNLTDATELEGRLYLTSFRILKTINESKG